jgi:hypothetical protein
MFTIIGGDDREYGPVPASEVNGWIMNGRANLQTRAKRLSEDVWRTLGEFPEFSSAGTPAAPPPASPPEVPSVPANPEVLFRRLPAAAPKLDVGACLSRGWELWLDHFGQLFLAYLVVVPISLALSFVHIGSLPVATLVLGGVFTAGMYRYALKLLHHEPATISDLFAGFSEAPGPLIVAGIAIAFFTLAGFFLIIPGVYLAIAWTFTYPLILEKNLPVWPAMELSRRIITRNWWRMLIMMIAAALFSLMGLTLLLVGVILTLPISTCVLACAYDSLCNPKSDGPVKPDAF